MNRFEKVQALITHFQVFGATVVKIGQFSTQLNFPDCASSDSWYEAKETAFSLFGYDFVKDHYWRVVDQGDNVNLTVRL